MQRLFDEAVDQSGEERKGRGGTLVSTAARLVVYFPQQAAQSLPQHLAQASAPCLQQEPSQLLALC